MGDRPVSFQILSDQRQNFVSGCVNFEDPNFNVSLPVFTIHGNHDDPAGAENLSAVDILSTSKLVNYFGKARVPITGSNVGSVRLSPVLLQKGATKVALYGLGNLRDERLCRLFHTPGAVQWVRPADTPAHPQRDWFNIFALHQNRVAHTQGAKNVVREGHLPRFLDLVVWGHEHECLADPWDSAEAEGAFSVVQPGSSVATSLSEGEARAKHAVVLEVARQSWRTFKVPLQTVRPFRFASVALASILPLDSAGARCEDPELVGDVLVELVTRLADEAMQERRGWRETRKGGSATRRETDAPSDVLSDPPSPSDLPL
ncbi:hypothetical protein H632_c3537p0, partial [Helicosporidium sp. ATCC 50920]